MDSVVAADLTVSEVDEGFLFDGFSGDPRSLKLAFLAKNVLRLWAGSCNEVIGMDGERSRERESR